MCIYMIRKNLISRSYVLFQTKILLLLACQQGKFEENTRKKCPQVEINDIKSDRSFFLLTII